MMNVLHERQQLYGMIQNIKMRNPQDQTSKAMKILKQLLTNIRDNPRDLKFRVLKTTNPNINNYLMNIVGINDLLYYLGYKAKYDGNFIFDNDDFNNLELCLSILNSDIDQFNERDYIKETSQQMMQNPEVAKEMEKKRKKIEEDKKQKDRINELIEADKIERKYRFNYK